MLTVCKIHCLYVTVKEDYSVLIRPFEVGVNYPCLIASYPELLDVK